MRMMQKVPGKRYFIYARRSKNEKWTDWTQTNAFDLAINNIKNIRKAGFLAKLIDKQSGVLITDGEKEIS